MELTDEQRPPESIWLNAKALNDHFEVVAERMRSGTSMEPVDDVPLMQNEYTAGLRR